MWPLESCHYSSGWPHAQEYAGGTNRDNGILFLKGGRYDTERKICWESREDWENGGVDIIIVHCIHVWNSQKMF